MKKARHGRNPRVFSGGSLLLLFLTNGISNSEKKLLQDPMNTDVSSTCLGSGGPGHSKKHDTQKLSV